MTKWWWDSRIQLLVIKGLFNYMKKYSYRLILYCKRARKRQLNINTNHLTRISMVLDDNRFFTLCFWCNINFLDLYLFVWVHNAGGQRKAWEKRSVATSIPWFTLHTEAWRLQPAPSSTTSILPSLLYSQFLD